MERGVGFEGKRPIPNQGAPEKLGGSSANSAGVAQNRNREDMKLDEEYSPMKARFRFPNSKIVPLQYPKTPSTDPSTFLVGVKKGGSTLMAKVMRDLSEHCRRPVFEFSRIAFSMGLPGGMVTEDVDNLFLHPGYVFGVFRWLPESDVFRLGTIESNPDRKATFLSLFRDPRDILVSLYYSDAKSHALPETGPLRDQMLRHREALEKVGLDDYVLQKAPSYLRHFYRTMQVETLPDSKVLRYEDIVYDKPALVSAVAEAMQADVRPKIIAEIARRHDQIPDREKEDRHIRQVHPGNYAKKLKPETIERLNDIFSVVLSKLDYKT